MKKLAIILTKTGILYSCFCSSQNLVPNYSFEVYDTCPNSLGQISFALGWFPSCKPSCYPFTGYAYFNACDTTQSFSVPYNGYGYQSAFTGNAYADIAFYNEFNSNSRGYVEIKLNNPLIQNKKYCVKFYVSQADISGFSINTIGCLFTTDSFLVDSINQEIFLIPQVENTDSIITDTMNWVLISGEFTASGGEQFLTIGNFRNDSNTSIIANSGGISSSSIYYIDDVSVTLCDTTVVEELKIEDYRLKIYPNPASGSVTVTAMGGDKIIITDIAGRKIKEYKISTNQLKINSDEYENGIYFLSLCKNIGDIIAIEKLIIAR